MASLDPSSPGEEEGKPLLPRTRLQAGPRQHRHRALPEPAAWTLDEASAARTLENIPLLLELQKLPGLASTDLSALNPNIQVRTMEGHGPSGHLASCWAEQLSSVIRCPQTVFLGGWGSCGWSEKVTLCTLLTEQREYLFLHLLAADPEQVTGLPEPLFPSPLQETDSTNLAEPHAL